LETNDEKAQNNFTGGMPTALATESGSTYLARSAQRGCPERVEGVGLLIQKDFEKAIGALPGKLDRPFAT